MNLMWRRLLLVVLCCTAVSALASDTDDIVFFRGGGRARGVVMEETPKSGVKLRLPDGSVRVYPSADIDHVQYGGQQVSQPPPPPAAPQYAPVPPAPVLAPNAPDRLPYQRGPVPAGYHLEAHRRTALWIIGACLIGTAIFGDILALTLKNGKQETNNIVAAVVGVIGFGAGIPMLIVGLIPVREFVRDSYGLFIRPQLILDHGQPTGATMNAGLSF